jgi:hypothetical protein
MNRDVTIAQQALTDHPHYRYRGCAPDVDDPTRAAGDLDLSVDAWLPGGEVPESPRAQAARVKAAKAVCGACPVLALCRTWAGQVGDDGRLAEREGIAGGLTALERHREFIASRPHGLAPAEPVPVEQFETPQKQAILHTLAAHAEPELVAAAAGMDARTASWQRSKLASMLGLDRRSATRMELLAEAGRRGLLVGVEVVPDDGAVLAVPRPVRPSRRSPASASTPVAPAVEEQPVPTVAELEAMAAVPPPAVRLPALRRSWWAAIDGQLALDLDRALDTNPPAPARHRTTSRTHLLEAAA